VIRDIDCVLSKLWFCCAVETEILINKGEMYAEMGQNTDDKNSFNHQNYFCCKKYLRS
jgi:hypothetical protein